MVNTRLRRAHLLCFQSAVCRTRRAYHTWSWVKSLQNSVPTAEAASLLGFTQTDCDSVWHPTGVLDLCHFGLIHQTSGALQYKLGNTTGSLKNPFLPSPEVPAVFRFPGSTGCSSANIQSFTCTCKALFFLSFLYTVCVNAQTSLHRSEHVGGHLIPQFPWIDS